MEIMINELKFTCCFCNKKIENTDIDPCNINIMANYDKDIEYKPTQDFFCHFSCLKNSFHNYYKGYLLESTFSSIRDNT